MTKIHLSIATIVLTLSAGLAETSWGRGFGGFHGGMRPGGMRPGGMNLGGMRPGGMRPGGMNLGGMRPGANFGGARPGGNPLSGGMRPAAFNPTNSVGNRASNFGGARPGGSLGGSPFGGGARPGGFNPTGVGGRQPGLGGRGFPGAAPNGFGGNRGPANLASREPGLGARGAAPNRSQLGNFLGMPSDGGLHSLAGNRLDRDERGLARRADEGLRQRGDAVRGDFRAGDFYSAGWYGRYPGAWSTNRWAYGDVWAAASWDYLDNWFGYENEQPIYYDYGNTVTYQDNSVYMNGQDMGTSDEYYQQAQTLASTGAEARTTDDTKWMPLGVFAMSHDKQTKANLIVQLAVNKEGVIRGNYTATLTNDTQPIQGSVDKKTQRAAWTIGKNKENVFETGIYNLTKDEAPILVHLGKDKTEQWLLVRVKKDAQQDAPQNQNNQ